MTRIGDYQLTRSLPAMAAGVCEFEATHVLLPRLAHIHIADRAAAPQLVRRACLLEALRHPGVPRVYECGLLDDHRPWIAYEALGGPTLAALMLERAWTPNEMLGVLRDLAAILDHAHGRGIAHGRLTPELVAWHDDALYITGWGITDANAREDIRALGAMMALTIGGTIPRPIRALLEQMAAMQPSAADVHAGAVRLLEGDEDVELELVDLEQVTNVG